MKTNVKAHEKDAKEPNVQKKDMYKVYDADEPEKKPLSNSQTKMKE